MKEPKETIEEVYPEFMKKAKQVKKYCEGKSARSCINGECRFKDAEKHCIFDQMGMSSPYEWELGGKKS